MDFAVRCLRSSTSWISAFQYNGARTGKTGLGQPSFGQRVGRNVREQQRQLRTTADRDEDQSRIEADRDQRRKPDAADAPQLERTAQRAVNPVARA